MESAPLPNSYDVLYFKRKNKVHKSKGVSKMDGRLVQQGVYVKLYEGGNNDGDSSNHSIKEPIPIQSVQNADLAKRTFQVDDAIALGQFNVEIVSVHTLDAPMAAKIKSGLFSTGSRGVLSVRNGQPTVKPRVLSRSGKVAAKLSIEKRRPPAQPKLVSEELSGSDDDHEARERVPPPRLKLLSKRRKPSIIRPTLSGQKRKLVPAAADDSLLLRSTPSLAGAIGTLVVPPSLLAAMRPHQHSGVVFLWNCLTGASLHLRRVAEQAGIDRAPRGAILADSMGMGKTLMTVAIVFAFYRRTKQQRFIIVCPSSLVQNWAREFDKWLGRASLPKRVVVKKGGHDGLQTIRGFVPVKPNQSEVLIISYDLFRMNASILTGSKQIGLLVVDEGHRLKNSSGSITMAALNSLNCEAKLLITGTPIQNNLSEFHSVANFVCPGTLGSLADFRREYERPITAANRKDATRHQREEGAEQSRALESIIKAFLLRRLAKDVLKDLLPPRTELMLFCRPSSRQCDSYLEITSDLTDPLSALCNLRKLCAHPDLLTPSSSSGGIVESGKLLMLDKLLSEIRAMHPEDKVVVVSCFTSILSMIESKLINPKGWGYTRLDGSTAQSNRQSLVDAFDRIPADKCFIFLLSSKAGGMGLNLVGANRLFMFDADYNPAIDAQAMARVYRPGQLKPTTIYRFFTSGTMEEVVLQRQEQKGSLANATVDGSVHGQLGKFTNEELRDCFTLKDTPCDTKNKMKSVWPEYDGSESLHIQGCSDDVILGIADDCSDVLRHVHIVQNESSSTITECIDDSFSIGHVEDSSNHCGDENRSLSESSDEGEYEFDG